MERAHIDLIYLADFFVFLLPILVCALEYWNETYAHIQSHSCCAQKVVRNTKKLRGLSQRFNGLGTAKESG